MTFLFHFRGESLHCCRYLIAVDVVVVLWRWLASAVRSGRQDSLVRHFYACLKWRFIGFGLRESKFIHQNTLTCLNAGEPKGISDHHQIARLVRMAAANAAGCGVCQIVQVIRSGRRSCRYRPPIGGPAGERLFVDSPNSFVCLLFFSNTPSELSAALATVVLLLPPPMLSLIISIGWDILFHRSYFPPSRCPRNGTCPDTRSWHWISCYEPNWRRSDSAGRTDGNLERFWVVVKTSLRRHSREHYFSRHNRPAFRSDSLRWFCTPVRPRSFGQSWGSRMQMKIWQLMKCMPGWRHWCWWSPWSLSLPSIL